MSIVSALLRPFRRFYREQSGASIILVAVMLPVLITVMAITVDIARLYVVQTKAQTALDSALLGAVATNNDLTSIRTDTANLFNANFAPGYMGSTITTAVAVTQPSANVYEATISVKVNTTIVGTVGGTTTFNIFTQVTKGFGAGTGNLEMSLVIDNSGYMGTGTRFQDVRNAANSLVNTIFGSNTTLSNVFVSVVPYNVSVNFGYYQPNWIQPDYQFLYFLYVFLYGQGFISNRNGDSPPDSFNDVSEAAPLVASSLFRLPNGANTFTAGVDIQYFYEPFIAFALNDKTQINAAINNSTFGGDMRTNVGMMWGWFTLSPNWQGMLDPGIPSKPAAYSNSLTKVVVLIVGGKNSVFLGVNGTSNDVTTTASLCTAMKAKGIKIYTVAYAASTSMVDQTMLQNCATSTSNYYFASTASALTTALTSIAGQLVSSSTLRLSK